MAEASIRRFARDFVSVSPGARLKHYLTAADDDVDAARTPHERRKHDGANWVRLRNGAAVKGGNDATADRRSSNSRWRTAHPPPLSDERKAGKRFGSSMTATMTKS